MRCIREFSETKLIPVAMYARGCYLTAKRLHLHILCRGASSLHSPCRAAMDPVCRFLCSLTIWKPPRGLGYLEGTSNARVFQRKHSSTEVLLSRIKEEAAAWCLGGRAKRLRLLALGAYWHLGFFFVILFFACFNLFVQLIKINYRTSLYQLKMKPAPSHKKFQNPRNRIIRKMQSTNWHLRR